MKTRLMELIEERGLERKKIAKDLNIERRTLDNYITENTLMNSEIIKKMAAYFNVSTDYLLGVDPLSDEIIYEKINHVSDEMKSILYHIHHKENDRK